VIVLVLCAIAVAALVVVGWRVVQLVRLVELIRGGALSHRIDPVPTERPQVERRRARGDE
jgi:hypothetical protein